MSYLKLLRFNIHNNIERKKDVGRGEQNVEIPNALKAQEKW